MKKILYIILILIVCSSISFGANETKQQNPPPSKGQEIHGLRMGYFGISKEDYDKLNLSKAQKSKVEALNKKYMPKEGERPDFSQMQKNEVEKEKAFRALLTDTQKKQYDKAKASQKAKQKEMFSKRYKDLAKELKFTQAQNDKLNSMLKNFNGNPMEFDKKFESILSASQKKTYEKKKQEFRQHGPQGPGPKEHKDHKK